MGDFEKFEGGREGRSPGRPRKDSERVKSRKTSNGDLDFTGKLWKAADKLRSNMDAAALFLDDTMLQKVRISPRLGEG